MKRELTECNVCHFVSDAVRKNNNCPEGWVSLIFTGITSSARRSCFESVDICPKCQEKMSTVEPMKTFMKNPQPNMKSAADELLALLVECLQEEGVLFEN